LGAGQHRIRVRWTDPAERQQELGHVGCARHGLRLVIAATGGRRREHHLAHPGVVARTYRSGPIRGIGASRERLAPCRSVGCPSPSVREARRDGQGFEIMMSIVLPVFSVLNAACSNGLMASAIRRTVEHITQTRHSDTGAALSELPTIRNYIARMRV